MARHQKKARQWNAWLVFLDESGLLMAPLLRRSWSRCGCTPLLYQRTRCHQKVSVIAALCVGPARRRLALYFRLHADHNITAGLVRQFLRELLHELDGPVVLLWDRLLAHRARRVQRFLCQHPQLHPHFLPPYAPELNPVEYVWSHLKINPLANAAIADVETLAQLARHHGRRVQRNQGLLTSFLKHSPLRLRLV
jgi:transposase